MSDNFNKAMHTEELEWIKIRRKEAGFPEGTDTDNTAGLSLSGGGIRSATFNLGLLQAMKNAGALKYVDYLSTVSGGGYIGSSLTWLMSLIKKFPFGTKRKDYKETSAKIVDWLRNHGKYMTPGGGLNIWSVIAAILAGILVNLSILLPVFAVVVLWLSPGSLLSGLLSNISGFFGNVMKLLSLQAGPSAFTFILVLGLALFALYLLMVLFTTITSRIYAFRTFLHQRIMREWAGQALLWSIICVVVGSIPYVNEMLARCWPAWKAEIISSISLAGILSMLSGLINRKDGNESKGIRSVLLSVGLALLIYGLFLLIYHCVNLDGFEAKWIYYSLIVSFIVACIADINHVSMHRFYRNRLMEAYFPYEVLENSGYDNVDSKTADRFLIKDIKDTASPYQLVCTNIQTVGSDNPKLSERGGDSFIFSPKYSGSDATGYAKTENYVGGNMNLATAFAISGAAVDANTYATRSRPLAFIMALLNIRLGYWIPNPTQGNFSLNTLGLRPVWYYYMLAEMLGKGLSEKQMSVHLSDGGHFENLGLYELIRRKCRIIISSDAGADPDYSFGDLGKAMERVRVDFGVRIDMDINPIKPNPDTKISSQPFAIGEITYDDNSKAILVYIKTSIINDLPEDIYTYKRENDAFPNQSTADQFFDESQFEAYRELGFRIGQRIFGDIQFENFEGIEKQIKAKK